MLRHTFIFLWLFVFFVAIPHRPAAAQSTEKDVRSAMHRAVGFFREHASAGGGYIFQMSADLSKREGEGKVGPTTAWIEPPGTPAVGMAYLEAYWQCGDELLLEAAKETAGALVRGQLRSGGWDNLIEFEPSKRKKYAYRVDRDDGKKRRNTTTFDDDKSQSVIYDDDRYLEAAERGGDFFLQAQLPEPQPGWAQQYDKEIHPSESNTWSSG